MRLETKERADTIIGSVLRGSFTFYQATAGDMRGEMEAEWKAGRAGETKRQKLKHVLSLQTLLRSNIISLVDLNLSGWDYMYAAQHQTTESS